MHFSHLYPQSKRRENFQSHVTRSTVPGAKAQDCTWRPDVQGLDTIAILAVITSLPKDDQGGFAA